jgi:DNA-binding CsgD family transcriptional regulator
MPKQPLLSEREAQVVGAAAMGHANKTIAYELGISISSVATHLRRAAAKLGTGSRAEIIRAYAELFLRD